MSPKLFRAVLEYAFKMLDWEQKGIINDGEYNNQRFADDVVLIADNLKEAEDMLKELIKVIKM